MANHMTVCFFPCFCEKCKQVVTLNLLGKELQCDRCKDSKAIPFSDQYLLGEPGKHVVAEWRLQEQPLVLADGKHTCPRCGKMTLSFKHSGLMWD